MSNYSGYSSASRLALEQMSAQMANMQALLVANGIVVPPNMVANTDHHALTQSTAQSQPLPALPGGTPSRKRHLSQQQQSERMAKGSKIMTGGANRFEILTQSNSYPDKSMRPGSVSSAPGTSARSLVTSMDVQDDIPALIEAVLPNQVDPLFGVNNDGPFRQEIEVGIATLNGNKFFGSITHTEAKFTIFRDCLGFGDCSNFDGVRHSYKGMPVLTFKLKSAINIDELIGLQFFEFKRKSTRNGVNHVDTIGCKIRGLRTREQVNHSRSGETQHQDDGSRLIRIEGCEYRIPENVIIDFLSHYGEITSKIVEELFEDGVSKATENDGTNRTGTYALRIKLKKNIPQLLPMLGKRIKIDYPGIQRLCTNCFKSHHKKNCQSKKVSWKDYACNFARINHEIPDNLFGEWMIRQMQPVSPASTTTPTADWVHQHAGNPIPASSTMGVGPVVATMAARRTGRPNAEKVQIEHVNAEKVQTDPPRITAPTRVAFGIPQSKAEHTAIVAKLVAGGSSEKEAEFMITSRKAAFNKANREYKKALSLCPSPSEVNKGSTKKPHKQVQHVSKTTSKSKHA